MRCASSYGGSVDPFRCAYQVNLGNAYAMLGREREALQAFRRAVELEPAYGGMA